MYGQLKSNMRAYARSLLINSKSTCFAVASKGLFSLWMKKKYSIFVGEQQLFDECWKIAGKALVGLSFCEVPPAVRAAGKGRYLLRPDILADGKTERRWSLAVNPGLTSQELANVIVESIIKIDYYSTTNSEFDHGNPDYWPAPLVVHAAQFDFFHKMPYGKLKNGVFKPGGLAYCAAHSIIDKLSLHWSLIPSRQAYVRWRVISCNCGNFRAQIGVETAKTWPGMKCPLCQASITPDVKWQSKTASHC